MKKILFAGNSLTHGHLGRGFLPLLREDFPGVEFINWGKGGDTLAGIGNRTLKCMAKDSSIAGLVIEAGHNDIILPDFMNKTLVHKSIAKTFYRKASAPALTPGEFISRYRETIRSIRALSSCPLAVTTLSCISEDLTSPPNIKRSRFNEEIRKMAGEEDLLLLDVAKRFDSILEESGGSSYLMDDVVKLTRADKRASGSDQDAKALSKERGLVLTIDGVHLNGRGALLYKETLSGFVESLL